MAAGQPQEVQFPFSIDLTKAASSIEQLQGLVRELATTTANAQKGLQASFDETARAEKQVAVAATEATAAVSKTTAATVAQEKAASGLAATTKTSSVSTAAATVELTKTAAAAEKVVKSQNALAKGYGLIKTAANVLPGLGISGIFLGIFTAISAAAEALDLFAEKQKNLADKVKKNREESEKYVEALNGIERATLKGQVAAQGELVALDSLYRATQNANLSQKERLAAVDELQKKFPDYFGKLSDEAILAGQAATAYNELKEAIISGAKARAAAAIIEEDQKTVLTNERRIVDLQKEQIKNLTDYQKLQVRASVSTGGGGSTGGAGALGNVSVDAQVDAAQRKINENVKKEGELRLLNIQLKEQDLDLTEEINKQQEKGGIAAITGSFGDPNAGKKAADDAKKAQALRLAQEKAFNDLLFKIIQERQSFQAKSITDDEQAEISASNIKFQQLVEARTKEVQEAKVNADQRKQLEIRLVDDILTIDQAANQARLDIQAKYEAQRRKLVEAAESAIATLGDNRQEIEIKKIEEEYKQKAETIRKGGLLTLEVQRSIETAQQNAIDDVNIKYGSERIKKQTELEIAGIKVAEKFQGESVKVEKAKQIAILDAQLSGALAQLTLLETNGKDKNSLEVRQAEETVNNIRQAIKNASKQNEKFSLFQSLFGGLSEDDQANLKLAFSTTVSAYKNITDSIIAQYQRQIDAKQKLIDKDNELVDEAKDNLDKQLDLQRQGYANDVGAAQTALEAKIAQRDADLKDQEELQRKQEAIQRQQQIAQEAAIIAQNVQTGVDMVGAIAKVFKAHAGIPFVGVALGVGFTALLLSTFLSLKNVLSGNTTKRAKGGEIDGPSHASGGVKYRAVDGSGRVEELEGGEYVINRRSTKRARKMIEAINTGEIFNLHPESLESMLTNMGIELPDNQPAAMIMQVAQRDEAVRQSAANSGNSALDNIDKNVGYLASSKRNEVKRWEDEKYFYVQEGSKIMKKLK